MTWWQNIAAVAAVIAVAAGAALRRKPGTPTPVSPAERERRAMAILAGPRIIYGLGCGGADPRAASPAGPYVPRKGDSSERRRVRKLAGRVFLDCSGAVAYVLGIPRKIADYARGWGYFSTDGAVADANDSAVELLEWAAPGEVAVPWRYLVVYGGEDTDGDGDRDRIGHIGIVCGVPPGWTYRGSASLAELDVWHCAASASPTGAVRVSKGTTWRRVGKLARII